MVKLILILSHLMSFLWLSGVSGALWHHSFAFHILLAPTLSWQITATKSSSRGRGTAYDT